MTETATAEQTAGHEPPANARVVRSSGAEEPVTLEFAGERASRAGYPVQVWRLPDGVVCDHSAGDELRFDPPDCVLEVLTGPDGQSTVHLPPRLMPEEMRRALGPRLSGTRITVERPRRTPRTEQQQQQQ